MRKARDPRKGLRILGLRILGLRKSIPLLGLRIFGLRILGLRIRSQKKNWDIIQKFFPKK